MSIANPPPETSDRERVDDYSIQRDPGQLTRPVSHNVLDVLNFLLLLILGVVSFALFWVVATLVGFL